uniref:NET domain-containing protein n=1 Tax=viral metagenome TaxID=1070528 RepID=A0A6C0E3H2_9ZZZZ
MEEADTEYEEEYEYNSIVLNTIRETIESMSKFNQIEVLRILHSHKEVIINENKYGIHINLTELPGNIINELSIYIDYVKKQEVELSQAEQQKETYKNTYFINDKK